MMQAAYQIFSAMVIVAALLLIPYNVFALLYHESDATIKEIRADPDKRFWPSLYYFTQLTVVSLVGMLFIMGTTLVLLALQAERIGETTAQSAPALFLIMLRSLAILLVLSSPAVFLIRIKLKILNIHPGRRPRDRTIERGPR